MTNDRVRPEGNRELKWMSVILLVLAILLGIVVRWNFISQTDFPINDGGFFYQMIVELIDNRFQVPDYTDYNRAQIPYAYPPLSFYITGVLTKVTGASLFDLLRYVPFTFNILTILAFFFFTSLSRTLPIGTEL